MPLLAELTEQSYVDDFMVDGEGYLCCPVCGICTEPAQVHADQARWLEHTAPEVDGVMVLALCCPACRTRGIAIVLSAPDAPHGDTVLLDSMQPRAWKEARSEETRFADQPIALPGHRVGSPRAG